MDSSHIDSTVHMDAEGSQGAGADEEEEEEDELRRRSRHGIMLMYWQLPRHRAHSTLLAKIQLNRVPILLKSLSRQTAFTVAGVTAQSMRLFMRPISGKIRVCGFPRCTGHGRSVG